MFFNPEIHIFKKNIKGIIHIGASDCRERLNYMKYYNLKDDNIIWINAMKDFVEQIILFNPIINIYNECMYNENNKIVSFTITDNYENSSILKINKKIKSNLTNIIETEEKIIGTKRLDSLCYENNIDIKQFNLLLIEACGVELEILKGTPLYDIDYIYLDIYIKELYNNCNLFEEIEQYLEKYGFIREYLYINKNGYGNALFITK